MRRKICVVTGSRAEYGLLYWLMKEIDDDHDLELQIVATGMHLSPEFGLTYKVIEQDGFKINEKVEMLLSGDTPTAIAKSVGLGVIGFADAFAHLKPDVVVILGDRFEIFAAAQVAMISQIPIAHLHGGEATEGVMDESIRHSITKMSNLHFTATEIYKQRVLRLGENPQHVYNVGALGVEYIKKMITIPKSEIEEFVGIKFNKCVFVVTFHPVVTEQISVEQQIEKLLKAIETFPSATVIFTKSNADVAGRVLNQAVDAFVAKHPNRMRALTSLGQDRYLSLLQYSSVVIGNSSSGILEAPSFQIPTVNVGKRQQGRVRVDSIIDVPVTADKIKEGIETALSEEFRSICKNVHSPYGEGDTSNKIVKVLKTVELKDITTKHFYDAVGV